jgi:dihydrofolate reductase
MIKLILAVDRGNAIGWADGRLPWKIPADMKRFKELTTGHPVVMGYNTFISLGRPAGLPNRENIVLTRRNPLDLMGKTGDDVKIISSLNYVKPYAKQPDNHLWIIGGASVYDEAIEAGLADEIYLTLVDDDSGADVRLSTDLSAWKLFVLNQLKKEEYWLVADVDGISRNGDTPAVTFITLKRLPK